MEVAVIITWVGMLIASLFNSPTTTVVLIDNNKIQNAVVVKTDGGSTVIDKPGQYVNISSKNQAPSQAKSMSDDEIQQRFQSAIQAVPLAPTNVLLYFKTGSNELTDESTAKLPEVIEKIRKRMPCDVNIIGHTDTEGSNEYNVKLSLQRAYKIKDLILVKNMDLKNLKVESYGENDLLIKTADNISEPKNRRVEILIK